MLEREGPVSPKDLNNSAYSEVGPAVNAGFKGLLRQWGQEVFELPQNPKRVRKAARRLLITAHPDFWERVVKDKVSQKDKDRFWTALRVVAQRLDKHFSRTIVRPGE